MVRPFTRGLMFVVVVLFAMSLCAESVVVRCESKGGRRICPAGNVGSVVIKRQRSMASCTQGQSWGYTRDAIWVDDGCRADFQVFTRRYDRDDDRDRDQNRGRDWADLNRDLNRRVICESRGGRELCAADTRFGVRIARTFGGRDCIEGNSWGFNDRVIWVDRGCRAEFIVGNDRDRDDRDRDRNRYDQRMTQVVVCESNHDRRNHCAADTRLGVEMKKQLSLSDCTFNKTWGYDRYGIWVTSGCRAEFLVRGR